MKKIIVALLSMLIMVPAVVDAKDSAKENLKRAKKLEKTYKKEGWKLFGSSFPMGEVLTKHFETLERLGDGATELMGTASVSDPKHKNMLVQAASTNAYVSYAGKCRAVVGSALNKMDLLPQEAREAAVNNLREGLGDDDISIFPVSCATGEGLWDVLKFVRTELTKLPKDKIVYETEYDPEREMTEEELPFTVTREKDEYFVEGPRIEKMLGYTNLESEKGFLFFQNFLRDNGINDELIRLGINEGDTVHVCNIDFEYYE